MGLEASLERVFVVFNLCEGVLWLVIAAAFVLCLLRRRDMDLKAIAALLFMTFGLSDFVEIQTGGWYKPWWLFAWKASNLAGFAIVYIQFRRRKAERLRTAE